MRLLVVEDDARLRSALRNGLERHGHAVTSASRASEALRHLRSAPHPDMVLLDLSLPDANGFSACRRIRAVTGVPIVILTARGSVDDRVSGLNMGADDYMTKPFHMAELIARMDAVIRRSSSADQRSEPVREAVALGPLRIDADTRTVKVNGTPRSLTLKEFELLSLLASQPGIVFRREQIIDRIWDGNRGGADRTLESHVASLRTKLGIRSLIETVRGVGYRVTID